MKGIRKLLARLGEAVAGPAEGSGARALGASPFWQVDLSFLGPAPPREALLAAVRATLPGLRGPSQGRGLPLGDELCARLEHERQGQDPDLRVPEAVLLATRPLRAEPLAEGWALTLEVDSAHRDELPEGSRWWALRERWTLLLDPEGAGWTLTGLAPERRVPAEPATLCERRCRSLEVQAPPLPPGLADRQRELQAARPDFSWPELTRQLVPLFAAHRDAYGDLDPGALPAEFAPELAARERFWIERYRDAGRRRFVEEARVTRATMVQVEARPGHDLVTVALEVRGLDTTVDRDDALVAGNAEIPRATLDTWTLALPRGPGPLLVLDLEARAFHPEFRSQGQAAPPTSTGPEHFHQTAARSQGYRLSRKEVAPEATGLDPVADGALQSTLGAHMDPSLMAQLLDENPVEVGALVEKDQAPPWYTFDLRPLRREQPDFSAPAFWRAVGSLWAQFHESRGHCAPGSGVEDPFEALASSLTRPLAARLAARDVEVLGAALPLRVKNPILHGFRFLDAWSDGDDRFVRVEVRGTFEERLPGEDQVLDVRERLTLARHPEGHGWALHWIQRSRTEGRRVGGAFARPGGAPGAGPAWTSPTLVRDLRALRARVDDLDPALVSARALECFEVVHQAWAAQDPDALAPVTTPACHASLALTLRAQADRGIQPRYQGSELQPGEVVAASAAGPPVLVVRLVGAARYHALDASGAVTIGRAHAPTPIREAWTMARDREGTWRVEFMDPEPAGPPPR